MPYLLEKIVEKVVIMPQVVEIIKYVHEIVEESTLGVATGVDINISEVRYKELYGQVRIHFEGVLVELRKLKIQTPGLKIQIDIIETFLIELDKLIQFPKFYEVEKEKIVEKIVNQPILVPTLTSDSIKTETSYAVLIDQLVAEIKRIKNTNPNVNLQLNEDVTLMFFSDLLDGNKLQSVSADLGAQLKSYKESQKSKLFSLGTTWTNEHNLMINTILDERFTMANVIKQANLEVEKSKSIADQRLHGYKMLRQNYTLSQTKLENLERELGVITKNFENNSSVSGELRRLFVGIDEIRSTLTIDPKTLKTEEFVQVLGDIKGSGDGYIRLQSAFRSLEVENQLLRDKYVKWQKTIPNAGILSDKERIIENLSRQIAGLTTDVSMLRSQPSTSVNVSSNVQEYEIKIRTLNSRIQELESQLRTQRVDYEGQLRQKANLVRELEERLASVKIDDSRATGIQSSGVEKMTSSQHSNSSGSQLASSYTTSNISSNVSQTGGLKTYGTYGTSGTDITPTTYAGGNSSTTQGAATTSTYKSSSYGATGGLSGSGVGVSGGATYGQPATSTYATSGATGLATSGATYGAATGATTTLGSSGTYGSATGAGSSSGTRYSTSTSGVAVTSGTPTSVSAASGQASGQSGASGTGASYTPYTSYYKKP